MPEKKKSLTRVIEFTFTFAYKHVMNQSTWQSLTNRAAIVRLDLMFEIKFVVAPDMSVIKLFFSTPTWFCA